MLEHGQVRVCGYVELRCAYCVKEGASTVIDFVTVINEVYKRRMANAMLKRMMNNIVDIR
jgi:hypothetical protein